MLDIFFIKYYNIEDYDILLLEGGEVVMSEVKVGKNENFEKQIDYYMGMIDVMPTIGNMFGIYNKYALGNDIFEIKDDNVIAFPNGNFLTNKVYYYNSKEEYKAINLNEVLSDEYITNAKNKADKLIDISNDIIVYDLIGVTSDERDKK